MKKILLSLLLCLALPCTVAAAPPAEVSPLNLAGLTELLAQNKGKVVLLNFFATWCPPCRAEIPELVGVHKKMDGKDVLIIGLSVDEKTDVLPGFMEKMKMEYPVYLAGRDIVRAFQVRTIPHNAFYGKDGTLVISEPGLADAHILETTIGKLLEQK